LPRIAMIYNDPTLKLATTEAGLTTGTAVECQTITARIEATANYNTIPATACAGATQSPGLDSWALNLTWLDDWEDPLGLSQFAFDNSGKEIWWELDPSTSDTAKPTFKGHAYAVSGGMGGNFGDGSAAQSTSSWPCLEKPTITPGTMAAAEAA
jgi:hypothetical protein